MSNTSKYSLGSATSIVVANMVGTGIFVSLGYQLIDIQDLATILALWLIGGIVALCGAFSYSELGAALPNSGGEYLFLSRIFHPSLGFMSGWMSSTIGFAAPVALNAMLFAAYFQQVFPQISKMGIAISLIAIITLINATNHAASGRFQKIFTLLKVLFIVVFISSLLICRD